MYDFLISLFTITGGIVWILAFAWFVGWAGDKAGFGK